MCPLKLLSFSKASYQQQKRFSKVSYFYHLKFNIKENI